MISTTLLQTGDGGTHLAVAVHDYQTVHSWVYRPGDTPGWWRSVLKLAAPRHQATVRARLCSSIDLYSSIDRVIVAESVTRSFAPGIVQALEMRIRSNLPDKDSIFELQIRTGGELVHLYTLESQIEPSVIDQLAEVGRETRVEQDHGSR